MEQSTTQPILGPSALSDDPLTDILRRGAHTLLAQAIEAEVTAYLEARAGLRDQAGRQQVVRNGYLPERTIQTGVGAVDVHQPRVRDRRPPGQRETFTSAILPPYLRKTKSLEELIPWLYLKGVSTGDFSDALKALLGPDAPGLSATTITRLKAAWETEYDAWAKRPLKDKRYVYVWADGVHFNIRLEQDRQCILVLMGATADGTKELIAVADGYRESEQSWKELLLDCKARGLSIDPALAIGDGALGFWKAVHQVWPTTRGQRCTVHSYRNIFTAVPTGKVREVAAMLKAIHAQEDREAAEAKAAQVVEKLAALRLTRAAEAVRTGVGETLSYMAFPREHWTRLRTNNTLERLMREIRRRTRVVGNFPDGASAVLLVAARLRHVAGTKWGTRRYLDMDRLREEVAAAAG